MTANTLACPFVPGVGVARTLDTPPLPYSLFFDQSNLSLFHNAHIRLCVAPVSLLKAEDIKLTHASSGILS